MKTRLTFREDTQDFKFPVILPSDHPVVTNLMPYLKHKELFHCGIQTLIARKKYWILKVGKQLESVIRKCYLQRFHRQTYGSTATALCLDDRINDASCFEVTGIDLAGQSS
ncbi:reverse transcriptase [Caerostris extrusa]|uniref:Reverse transcriptase n=1 Tax=Caerostris extrusa TaxID=172846 RepID=A0AAV4M5Z9_CAEEX|nr:reverse transcriptase [Caerostris extrusa]